MGSFEESSASGGVTATTSSVVAPRNPVLVVLWSYGLLVLANLHQYVWMLAAAALAGVSFGAVAGGEVKTQLTVLLRGVGGLLIGVPLALLLARYLWRRSLSWMALCFHPGRLLIGVGLGLGSSGLVVALLLFGGMASVTGLPGRWQAGELVACLAGAAGWAAFVGTSEELVFRGMAARELAARWGWGAAVALGGLYFGASHLLVPPTGLGLAGVGWVLLAAIAFHGLMIALWIRFRSLWLPIGFHVAWNFSLAAVFGTAMSGKESSFGLLSTELSGSPLLTGGAFGVEASVVTVLLYTVLGVMAVSLPSGGQRRLPDPRLPWA